MGVSPVEQGEGRSHGCRPEMTGPRDRRRRMGEGARVNLRRPRPLGSWVLTRRSVRHFAGQRRRRTRVTGLESGEWRSLRQSPQLCRRGFDSRPRNQSEGAAGLAGNRSRKPGRRLVGGGSTPPPSASRREDKMKRCSEDQPHRLLRHSACRCATCHRRNGITEPAVRARRQEARRGGRTDPRRWSEDPTTGAMTKEERHRWGAAS